MATKWPIRFERSHGVRAMVLVALTGWGQEEDRRRSRDAGFNHHLTKPVDPLELTSLLARLSQAQSAGSATQVGAPS